MIKVDNRTQNVPSTTGAINWVNLPGASVPPNSRSDRSIPALRQVVERRTRS